MPAASGSVWYTVVYFASEARMASRIS